MLYERKQLAAFESNTDIAAGADAFHNSPRQWVCHLSIAPAKLPSSSWRYLDAVQPDEVRLHDLEMGVLAVSSLSMHSIFWCVGGWQSCLESEALAVCTIPSALDS